MWFGVIGWLCLPFVIVSLAQSAWLLIHPIFAAWIIEQSPGSHDDLSGGMRFFRIPDLTLILLRIAMAVWLLWVAKALRRRQPGSVAGLRRWCVLKLMLESLIVGVTYMQMAAHFGSRPDMGPQETFWASFGMAAWTAATGWAVPLLILAWLALPMVRKDEARIPKSQA